MYEKNKSKKQLYIYFFTFNNYIYFNNYAGKKYDGKCKIETFSFETQKDVKYAKHLMATRELSHSFVHY